MTISPRLSQLLAAFALIILGWNLAMAGVPRNYGVPRSDLNRKYQLRYGRADMEMRKVYQQALVGLDDEQRQKVQAAQDAWLKYRELVMAEAIVLQPHAVSYAAVADEAARTVTIQRTRLLQGDLKAEEKREK